MNERDLEETLERLIDATSLSRVVDALASIGRQKAEHLRVNWQDGATAREWDRAADACAKLAHKLEV